MTTGAFAGESYLCIADMATGFSYNKTIDKWEIAKFNVDDSKYVVSKSNLKGYVWEIKKIGDSEPISWCKEDINDGGYLHCEGFEYFKMNIRNLRFMSVYMIGYINDNIKENNGSFIFKEGGNTPSMQIGKCSPLP